MARIGKPEQRMPVPSSVRGKLVRTAPPPLTFDARIGAVQDVLENSSVGTASPVTDSGGDTDGY